MDKTYSYSVVRGSVSPEPLECINPYKNKWRIRWNIKEVEVDTGMTDPESEEPITRTEWEYMEAEFLYKPMINEIRAVVSQWYTNEVNPEEYYINDSKVWYSNGDMSIVKNQSELITGDMAISPNVTLDSSLASVAMDGMNNYSYTSLAFKNKVLDQISKANSINEINQIDFYSGFPEDVHSDTATLTIQSSMESYSNAEAQAVEFAKLMINNPAMASSIDGQAAVSMQSLYPVYDAATAEGTDVTENYRVRVVTEEDTEPEVATASATPMMARARAMTLAANDTESTTASNSAASNSTVKSDILYECIKAHKITADEVPGADTTLWKVAGIDNSGEFSDIIPFSAPMQLFNGMYYSEGGKTYRCFRDSGIPIYHSLSNLVNLYVGEVDSTDDPMSHAGTYEDPIPYVVGMVITNGTYYKENDIIYLCNRNSEIALTHHLSDLVNLYVIVATEPPTEHDGTKEDPIPYNQGMIIYNGKYYTQNGVLYLCNRDSEIALYHDLSQLVGQYVEIVEDEPDPEPTEPTGTKEDPIPFTPGMSVSDHLYYSEDGIIYECVNSGTINTKLSENTTHVIVADAHEGTAEDPIPYIVGMNLEIDKYYSEDGVTYKCIAAVEDLNERLVNAASYVEVYTPEPEEPAGTPEDPIPYTDGMSLETGKYYSEDGIVYEVLVAGSVTGRLSASPDKAKIYAESAPTQAGSAEDPIPFAAPMSIELDKYYREAEVTYHCTAAANIVSGTLSDQVGTSVEVYNPEPEPSEPTGTKDDPISFVKGMTLENGKYYTQDDVLYMCFRDSGVPINSDLSQLVDQYVSVVTDTEEHAGTKEDPIPYTTGMIIYNGKYYTQNDVLYLCNRDSEIALTHNLSDLVGLYVEIVQ